MKLSPTLIFFLFVQLLNAQVQDKVDFTHANSGIYVDVDSLKIKGSVEYSFNVISQLDTFFLDAQNMKIFKVELNGKEVDYLYNTKKLIIHKKLKPSAKNKLFIQYETQPKQTVYFLGWDDDIPGNDQVWTQGQGKYTSHWLPSLDDMTEKVEFDLDITLKEDYQVIANGKLKKKDTLPDSKAFLWQFDMTKPMSSYLVGFAIGDFDKKELKSSSGVPIELYYEPKDSLKAEPTYRYTQHIFDFLEKEIGVPYPWQNYKQVPVQDFLYAGMENTTCTIFSNQYVIDSTAFVDKNYVNVNAHELAHQWFGNLVTEESGSHHWLHEGFATFYAYLAEKDIFGEEYFYWHLLGTAEALERFSQDGNGEELTNSGAGSLTFYEKGAWALVMLQDRVGHASFRQGIKNYLTKYAFQNVTIPDFMWEMEKASGMNLADFENTWLQDSDFPFDQIKTFLMEKSSSIKTYFKIKDSIGESKVEAAAILTGHWTTLRSSQLKHRLILDYGVELPASFISKILQTEDTKVRQAVALTLSNVDAALQKDFETLLNDKSYATLEPALYRLWTDFPEEQVKYLDKVDGVIGFPNKNIRLLWLTLALVTPEYRMDSKPSFFKELGSYTNSNYHFEVRLLAFQYLKSIGGLNDETLRNLIEACGHHVWHFKKSSRNMLKEFLKSEGSMARLKALYPLLNQEEQQYLDKTLGK
ncbi:MULTISPECIES: M1 family metallopeptidase [Flavobacteriaceae]|uniref:M1 family metallopeptidase n=1 Tax=Flavobacteriaceae TaxID=49546 RepID=UPI002349BE4C|nr:M1 family metallopeptidase [Muricauda sp. SP22]MDC6363228.1 M1 family metallopeptidase [Muricauda sp. SP22]